MGETADGIDVGTGPRPSSLPVVGLGASAGGIKALREFFSHVPPDTGIAWVVILHLSPDHDSRLAEVLQTAARIPVTQVTEREPIQPDHVYVVSPNQSLAIDDNALVLGPMTRAEHRRAPVDVFFRALADAHASHSVSVVLSGTGPNGSAGLKRVKEHGGLTIVQDPDEADFEDMPRNSIATGLVDFILPVAQMPDRIIRYFEGLRKADGHAPVDVRADPQALGEVLTAIRARTGHDFSNYKSATLERRVERRVHLHGLDSVAAYLPFFRQHPDEAVALMKDLLISVTNFFRDPPAWDVVEQRVLPRLFQNKDGSDHIRIWVPGCATGEEAYTIAILFAEYTATLIDLPTIQMFGSDLDEQAIASARDGVYTEAEVADLSEERLRRFFTREAGGGYRVRRDVREKVLFAHHNLLKDPPFSHVDLISCRNLLIYLNRTVQKRVIETFHFALRPGGFLFLGSAETPEGTSDLFLRIDGDAHLYESRSGTSRLALPLIETPEISLARPSARVTESRPAHRVSPADVHQRLLEQYAPPSLVATDEYNIVHMSERVGRYLRVPAGEPSRELLRIVHPDLRADLRTALHQAAREHSRIDIRNASVHFDEGLRTVDVVVRPVLRDEDALRGFFLVTFQEHDAVEPEPEQTMTLQSPAEPQGRELEDELARVKAELTATIDQYETQMEEAKAGNEELLSLNEELRSSAQELETSKEELQSVNEELTTVNQELKIKIEELRLTNNDFQNLINSTDIGTIFLDRDMKVKLFTPRAQDVFNLLDADVGRPLSDITCRLQDDRVHGDLRTVLQNLQTIEREMQTHDGRWHLMRSLPYRTNDNRIDGVVVTFQDISTRRQAEERVRRSEERLRLLIDSTVDYAILTVTEGGRIDSWNAGAERMFGYRADEIIGSPVDVLFTPEDREHGVPALDLEQARRAGRAAEEGYRVRKGGETFYVSGTSTRLGEGGLGFAKIARDMTGPRDATAALQRAQARIEEGVQDRTSHLEAEKRTVTDLLRRLVSAQEDERARIARDLHDSLGQQLTALRLALERHQQTCSAADPKDAITEALSLTRSVGQEIDFLAWRLRPASLDDLGLKAALPRSVEAWSAHVGIPAECQVRNFESGQLAPAVEVAFYRVAQEALNNVAKHAHATRADVVLSTADGQVSLVIEDDGVGFEASDPNALDGGIGLASMRERAALVGAALQIESAPGRGTSVFLRVPAPSPPGESP